MKEVSISDSSCARITRLHAKSISQNQVKGTELQSIKLKRYGLLIIDHSSVVIHNLSLSFNGLEKEIRLLPET